MQPPTGFYGCSETCSARSEIIRQFGSRLGMGVAKVGFQVIGKAADFVAASGQY